MKRGEKRTEKHAAWFIVLNANAVVESVDGGAPASWCGQNLARVADAPGVLRRAAMDLMRAEPTSYVRRRRVECVDESGTTKRELVVDLLLVESLPLHRTPSRVHDLVMRTLDMFGTQARTSKVDLTIEKTDGVPVEVTLDEEKIAWALSILVANGLRYAKTHVGVRLSIDDEHLVFIVSDDGPGVPEEKLRWLFERDADGHTAGLALPMVRDVMQAHRGAVDVQSFPSRGTRFTLRLPL